MPRERRPRGSLVSWSGLPLRSLLALALVPSWARADGYQQAELAFRSAPSFEMAVDLFVVLALLVVVYSLAVEIPLCGRGRRNTRKRRKR